MTEQEFERLSALVDDELPRGEISGEIRKLCNSDLSRATWSRYHLIGDAMRRELGPLYTPSLAQAISRRLQDEPVVLAPNALKQPASINRKTWAGLAIAASVAALAVTISPQLINPTGDEAPQQVAEVKPEAQSGTLYVAQDGTRWELLKTPEVESRLNAYLVNHQERSPSSNIKGIMPYATFVSYDGNHKK